MLFLLAEAFKPGGALDFLQFERIVQNKGFGTPVNFRFSNPHPNQAHSHNQIRWFLSAHAESDGPDVYVHPESGIRLRHWPNRSSGSLVITVPRPLLNADETFWHLFQKSQEASPRSSFAPKTGSKRVKAPRRNPLYD